MKHILINLPPELHDALEHLAGRNEILIGEIVRDAVRNDLRRRATALSSRMPRASAAKGQTTLAQTA